MLFGIDNMIWWPFAIAFGGATIIIGIFLIVLWIWMIIDAARRKFKNDVEKILWILIVVLGGWLGALVYLLVIKLSNHKGLAKKS